MNVHGVLPAGGNPTALAWWLWEVAIRGANAPRDPVHLRGRLANGPGRVLKYLFGLKIALTRGELCYQRYLKRRAPHHGAGLSHPIQRFKSS